MRRLVLGLSLLLGIAFGQDFTGTYSGDTAAGMVDVTLTQSGQTLRGTLHGGGVDFALDGYADTGFGSGTASFPGGAIAFEAHLQGDTLGLYLFELDRAGEPIVESAIELILSRNAAVSRPSPFRSQPLPRAAPAAGDDPLVGTFVDERLTLRVRAEGGGYAAEIESGGQVYPLAAFAGAGGLTGRFVSGGQTYTFTAALQGDAMVFVTAGTTYRLQRQGDPFASTPVDPFAAVPGPLPTATAATGERASPASAVVATGRHATLREDDALAFVEALEFVLEQIGYPYAFTAAERLEAVEEIARAFPGSPQQDQLVLADARFIWSRVQQNWSRSTEAERREFALGVLILAFGAETVQSWVGPVGSGGGQAIGGGGGGIGCSTFEECTSRFVDEKTWTDTFNAQGCWASAGCESYDAGTSTFTYSHDD
jgi:hypothetical protein